MGTDLHRVVVTCIIWRPRIEDFPAYNREYLIVQRSPDLPYRPLEWTVPGGGVQVGDWHDEATQGEEDAYNVLLPALMRELEEECGGWLDVRPPWLLEDYAFMRGDGVPVLGLSYVAAWEAGDVELNEENVAFHWVTVEESKQYNLIPDIHGELERAEARLDRNAAF